jgi:hypothetical protein
MSKFSSFLVFSFGILLLVVSIFKLGQGLLTQDRNVSEPEMVLPVSDLPPLHLGQTEAFHEQMDKLFANSGLDGVKAYVAQEFVPGRHIIISSSFVSEPDREYVLLDREMRRCNPDGGALMDKSPVVPRAAASLQINSKVAIHTWTRKEAPLPFYITAWCVLDKS